MRIDAFFGGFNEAQSKVAGNQVVKNLYPENSQSRVFYGTPGILERWNLGAGPIRGVIQTIGRVFAVSGGDVYELFSDYSSILRGSVANDGKPVSMASNRFEIGIVSATSVYMLNLTSSAIAMVAGLSLSQIVFADGYFMGLTPSSQQIRLSGQYAGTTWDVLDFTSAEGDPDDIRAIYADHREIWTFGKESVEVFYDAGTPAFPYERIPGALIEQGCAAAFSICKMDNALFWLGGSSRGDRILWRAQGYTPLRISNHAIEYQLSQMSTVEDCVAYSYEDQGHAFGVWSFPTGNRTFVYDCATQEWHERAYWDKYSSVWTRHKGQSHCFAFGKHFVGDYATGLIYEQNINFFDDNGQPKRWMRGFPLAEKNNRYIFTSNLELVLEVGKGIDLALGGDDPGNPQVMMRFSKDGGYTFGPERTCGAGKIGEYTYRCRWPGAMGQARKPYVELSGTDPFRVALVDFNADLEVGNA